MYTELARNTMKLIQDSYPELARFYNPQMGNFNFTKDAFKNHIESILEWLKQDEDYLIMYQEGEYWLTNFRD